MISKRSGLAKESLQKAERALLETITFVQHEQYHMMAAKAQEAVAIIDPDDAPFIACALALGCPLWSDDKALQRQNAVRVIGTTELLSTLNEQQ